ncbi:thioredoxin family protein [Candidatus Methanoliparum sp. LAM-1]|uniref:thioredoxin family protein n=1 Tax=Candidatus Methanoliparum sp. LAM-1 TaxID=2874846 RepID=UPI001E5F93DC|nr:DUF255 domain-containing protein [Candidatus Methanoliparum sp. LAM-1]
MIKKIAVVSLFLLLLSGSIFVSSVAETASNKSINWYTYDEGMILAKNQNKPVMIYFTTDLCPHCRNLEQNVFMDERMAEKLANNFVCIKVDADKEKDIVDKYKKGGFLGGFMPMPVPTVIFANSQGNEVYRIEGERSIEDFNKIVDDLLNML